MANVPLTVLNAQIAINVIDVKKDSIRLIISVDRFHILINTSIPKTLTVILSLSLVLLIAKLAKDI